MSDIKFYDFRKLSLKTYSLFYISFFLIYAYYSNSGYEYPYGYFLYNPAERFSDLFLQLEIFDLIELSKSTISELGDLMAILSIYVSGALNK